MTPDERRLIQDLFDRMRGMGRIDKDRDAETLIHSCINAHPDSLYMLVQNVIVQEHALAQSEQRMQELEAEVTALRQPQAQQGAGGGSFLGGLFGNRGAPATSASAGFGGGSVPSSGGAPQRQSPWGNAGAGVGMQSSGFQGSSTQQQPPVPQQAPRSGGGFLSGAMTTAAGVAGGMLAANAIGSMLGGHGGGLFGGGATAQQTHGTSPSPAPQETQQASTNDDGLTDEDYDIDTADDGGVDFGGGDSMDV